jgi:diguanylate cyclase (GGDEF)-like protein/PAS domain S-box-containing protein/putative nucleotidyltransferase with HDIG domain
MPMHDEDYKKIIEILPVGYALNEIITDEQGKIIDIVFVETNPAFLKISGLGADDLTGKSISEFIPSTSDVAKKYGENISLAAAGGKPVAFEYFSLTQKRWLNVICSSTHPGQLITLVTDVTKEKNSTPVEMENQILLGFLGAMKDGAFVKDQHCRYLLTNKALEESYNATAQEIWGREDGDFLPCQAAANCRLSDQTTMTQQRQVVMEEKVGDGIYETTKFPVHLPNGAIGVGGIIRDITAEKLHQEELARAQRQILEEKDRSLSQQEALFKGHGAVMLILEPESGQILDANPAASDFYGYGREELLMMKVQEINMLPPEETKALRMKALESQQRYFTFPHRLKSGEIRKVDVYASPIEYNEQKVLYSIIFDVTDREEAQEEIKFMSFHDYLTGVYNRRYFEEEFKRLNVPRNYPLAVVMGDVNGLKLINDSFGHAEGDRVLVQAGHGIQQSLRDDDIVARLGGDEFGILLPSTSAEDAADLLRRIQANLNDLNKEAENNTMALLSISFGYSVQKTPDDSMDLLMNEAESFMNSRKRYDSRSLKSKTISIAMNTLFEKSPREKMHSERVGNTAASIAEWMGLSEEKVNLIRIAGYLHDIGKIGIPETLLNKRGKLSKQDWETMKLHAEKSWRILDNTADYKDISNIVLCHHEKWDGTGYPRGLSGAEIPLESRIITIADSFDAMTHERPYHEGLGDGDAVVELQRCGGTHFDPVIVALFVDRISEIQG